MNEAATRAVDVGGKKECDSDNQRQYTARHTMSRSKRPLQRCHATLLLRMRIASSILEVKILPSPILPVKAVFRMVSTARFVLLVLIKKSIGRLCCRQLALHAVRL